MIYNIYRVNKFDVTNFSTTFDNNVVLWLKQIDVSKQEELVQVLTAGIPQLKFIVGQDVIVKYGKYTELAGFPNGTKVCPIENSMVYPLNWYTLLV